MVGKLEQFRRRFGPQSSPRQRLENMNAHHRAQHVILAAEVLVERRTGNIRACKDVLDPDGIEFSAEHQMVKRGADRAAGPLDAAVVAAAWIELFVGNVRNRTFPLDRLAFPPNFPR